MKTVNKKTFIFLLFLSMLLTSCNQSRSGKWEDWEQSFTVSQKLKSVPCMDEELILGGPVQMLYMDSSLLIHDVKTENLFWLIDMADKYKTYNFGRCGNAGNEFLPLPLLAGGRHRRTARIRRPYQIFQGILLFRKGKKIRRRAVGRPPVEF